MLICSFIFIFGSMACLGTAHPIDTGVESQRLLRERRSPMAGQPNGGGYQYDRAFNPQAGMAVYSTVVPSTFDEQPETTQPDVEEPKSTEEPKSAEEPASHEQEVPAQVEDDIKGVTVPSPKPKVLRGRSIDAKDHDDDEEDDDDDDDDDEDDDDDDDSAARKSGGSTYTNFFPLSFGAKLRVARNADGEDEDVIAISNSFGSGRGAVASSSAKAYARANTIQKTLAALGEPSRDSTYQMGERSEVPISDRNEPQ